VSLVVGVDVSTTATKAVLQDAEGTVRAVGMSAYSYETPHPLWSEQDPALWWEATRIAVREALEAADTDAEAVEAVGLTGQMHGLVALDDRDEVLRPAILWNDQRNGAECDAIRGIVGRRRLIEITGNDGKDMELNPRAVDIPITRPIGETYTGKDSQLDAATKELLGEIRKTP